MALTLALLDGRVAAVNLENEALARAMDALGAEVDAQQRLDLFSCPSRHRIKGVADLRGHAAYAFVSSAVILPRATAMDSA